MIDQQNLVNEQQTHAVNTSSPKYMPAFAGHIVCEQLASQTAGETAFAKDCKKTTASKGHKEPLLKTWDHPKLCETKHH